MLVGLRLEHAVCVAMVGAAADLLIHDRHVLLHEGLVKKLILFFLVLLVDCSMAIMQVLGVFLQIVVQIESLGCFLGGLGATCIVVAHLHVLRGILSATLAPHGGMPLYHPLL